MLWDNRHMGFCVMTFCQAMVVGDNGVLIFPSIRVFSNESALCIRWPKYWSFSFNISPSNEYPGLISFRMDRLDLLEVQWTLKSLLQHNTIECLALRKRRKSCHLWQYERTWMKDIIPSEINQTQKIKYCMSSLICKILMKLIESELEWWLPEVGGVRNWEVMVKATKFHLHKTSKFWKSTNYS